VAASAHCVVHATGTALHCVAGCPPGGSGGSGLPSRGLVPQQPATHTVSAMTGAHRGWSTCPAPCLSAIRGQGPTATRAARPPAASRCHVDRRIRRVTEGCAAQAAAVAGGGDPRSAVRRGPAEWYCAPGRRLRRSPSQLRRGHTAVTPWSHSGTRHAAIASPRPRAANIPVAKQTGRSVGGFQVKRGVQQAWVKTLCTRWSQRIR
jgi:hypothetical protein